MRPSRTVPFLSAVAAALALIAAAPPEKVPVKPAATPAPSQAGAEGKPAGVTPGPEHAVLRRDVGVWEARIETFMGPPGTPPQISTGTETLTLMGGLWLISDFKADMGGMPFQGHGVTGWDPAKKKYVSIWVDSMSVSIARAEGEYDAQTDTMTARGEGTDESGKPMTFRETLRWPDTGTRVFTMFMPGPDGRETVGMTITYKRKS